MKNMAGQVAIALENARLFQEAQQVIRELRTVQQQYLLEGWSGFSEDNEKLEYRIGDEEDDSIQKAGSAHQLARSDPWRDHARRTDENGLPISKASWTPLQPRLPLPWKMHVW